MTQKRMREETVDLWKAIRDRDAREMLARYQDAATELDPKISLNTMKHANRVSKEKMALEISLWIDTESFG